MKTINVKLGDLIIDKKLSELRKINTYFVSRYRQCYRNGVDMPLLIVQVIKGNKYRIVSGNHRYEAMLAEFGPDYEISVIVQKFKNEREVLETFTRENMTHGNALDGYSIRKLCAALIGEGMLFEEAAKLFNTSVQKIESWGKNMIMVEHGKETSYKPAKLGYIPEKAVSQKEYHRMDNHDIGRPVIAQANQLTSWITNHSFKMSDENINALKALQQALEDFFIWLEENEKVV